MVVNYEEFKLVMFLVSKKAKVDLDEFILNMELEEDKLAYANKINL